MSNDRLRYLLEQYAADASTPGETKELFEWIRNAKDDAVLKEKMRNLWQQDGLEKQFDNVDWQRIYSDIMQTPQKPVRHIWRQIAAAAVIIGIIFSATYFLMPAKNVKDAPDTQQVVQDITPPEINRAAITLADGTVVYLDSTGNGQLATQGNVKVVKYANGQIGYETADEKANAATVFNTLTNPRGSKIIDMKLSDGSKVWLNAGSSLTYPVIFRGNERKVAVKGEAYFEVAHDKTRPFFVTKGNMEVRVLGTQFNVDAYDDEDFIKVTLLEGSVKISNQSASSILKPGQQAEVTPGERLEIHTNINTQDVIAWKNGRFVFQRDDIQTIMRQLSRWYDVEVSYEGDVTHEKFIGVINRTRYQNISRILGMLEKTKTVSFEIKGRQVIVSPYKNK